MVNKVNFPPAYGGDGKDYTDDSDPGTGMGNGGFRTRLLPLLANVIAACNWLATQVAAAVGSAADSAESAAASAATALNAPGTSATSTTPLTIGTGNQALTVQAGKLFAAGMYVTIANTAAPAIQMYGIVTAYDSGTGAMAVSVNQCTGAGTAAAWTVAVAGGPGQSAKLTNVNATVTGSTTLAAAYLYVPVAMTAFGNAVTLPPANSLATGGPQYIFDNSKGAYPFGIRDNAGTLVMAVAPGGIAYVSLVDNTTVAGVWEVQGTNLEIGLVSIDNTFSSTYRASASNVFAAINSNQSIHFTYNAALTAVYAFIVDNVGKQVTTPVLIASGLTANVTVGAIYAVTATTFIVFYSDGTGSTQAVILSVSGTTITVGVPVTVPANATGPKFFEDGYTAPKIAQLSPTLYVLVGYTTATNTNAVVAFSVAGTTVTAGAPATFTGAAGSAQTAYPLTATTALLIYTGGSAYNVFAAVVSVTGTTCSLGTAAAQIGTGASSSALTPASCLLSPTQALVLTDGGVSAVYVTTVNVSGVTVTWGTPVLVDSSMGAAGLGAYTNRYAPVLFPLSATTALATISSNSGYSRSLVLSVSGTVVSLGAITYDQVSAGAATSGYYGAMLPPGTTEFVSVKQRGPTTAGVWPFAQPSKISGGVIAGAGYARSLAQLGPTGVPGCCNKLSNGDYVLGGLPGSELVVLRNNGDAINLRGQISVPPIVLPNQMQSGNVAPNRAVFAGPTNNSSTVGQTTYQLRVLSVEIAA